MNLMLLQNLKKQTAWAKTDPIGRLYSAIQDADAVIIGAGAGLSASAGFIYDGERFARYFRDFEEKYGFHDMYTGGFYPYETAEEHWAYWSRYIWVNRYMDAPRPVYQKLLQLVRDRDYFVLTTNVDHCFQKAGFDKNRLFCTQGDYGLFQCSEPCCQETWDNEETVRRMMAEQRNMRVPSELIPHCPRCEKPLTMNLRSDDKFVQDEGWYRAAGRYEDYLRRHQRGKVLYLELGVGYNTPAIIKYPFWKMSLRNRQAVFACVNRGQAVCPVDLRRRAICIDGDIGTVLVRLLTAQDGGAV